MKFLLAEKLTELIPDAEVRLHTLQALDKLMMFDVALVFETYIRSLVAEIETSRNKSEQYARTLEEKVATRTRQLEELSRTDPLTGLLNRRYLDETLTRVLRSAQRRREKWRWCIWTSTISSCSTTAKATSAATRCCACWARPSAASPASRTAASATAATSSASCCPIATRSRRKKPFSSAWSTNSPPSCRA